MKFCPACGTQLIDEAKFCPKCGTPFPEDPAYDTTPPYERIGFSPAYQPQNPGPSPYYNPGESSPYGVPPPYWQPYKPHTNTAGLIAWGVISILLCTIPGIVGLVYTLNIRKASSAEEESRCLSRADAWYTVATVLGVIALVYSLLNRGTYPYY